MATKQRIALVTSVPTAPTLYGRHAAVEKQVLAVKEGSVTWVDKAKGYYKGLIAIVGVLLIAATQLVGTLPPEVERGLTILISVLTTVGIILRANETWVDAL